MAIRNGLPPVSNIAVPFPLVARAGAVLADDAGPACLAGEVLAGVYR
jgi:hypothetical protein